MKKVITVCILDANRFFALGIQQILLLYFQRQGQGVCFVGENEAACADLVFWSVRKAWPLQLCQHCVPERAVVPVYIAVRAMPPGKTSRCLREQGSLWRRARPQTLLSLVEEGLKAQGNPVLPALCPCCMSRSLTEREREVMSCMSREMGLKDLPRHLNISHKTVSSHKRSVMRKLGFRRNAELYHWLRLGGLDHIKRP
ncbi:Spore germination protein gerE [Serratia plymuthica]|nr:two component system sensor kinase SsrB [Serratia plymuthica]VEI15233.1 Spore germination protein gerE [Serratia plymuthica]